MKQTPLNRSDSDNQRKGKGSYCSNETKQNKNKKQKSCFRKEIFLQFKITLKKSFR